MICARSKRQREIIAVQFRSGREPRTLKGKKSKHINPTRRRRSSETGKVD